MVKICTRCSEIKELELFKLTKSRKDGRSSWCKPCHSKSSCEYQKLNLDKTRLNKAKYKKTVKGLEADKRYKINPKGKAAKLRYLKSESGKKAIKRWRVLRQFRVKNTINDLTLSEWKSILISQNYTCLGCLKEFSERLPPTKDHIVPLIAGGGLTAANVQALCRSCNSKKGAGLGFPIQ